MNFRFRARNVALTVMLPCLVAGVIGVAPAEAVSADNWAVIAHRGYPGDNHGGLVYTESSMQALNRAANVGVSAVEVDVIITADNQFLIQHDEDMTRTTTCDGRRVSKMVLADILATCRGQVRGEKLLVPAQVLRWGKEHRINVVLDLKNNPNTWTSERLTRLQQVIVTEGMLTRTTVMSFNATWLTRMEQVNAKVATEWIPEGTYPGTAAIANVADVVNLQPWELTKARVAALHRAGVRVIAREANVPSEWSQARKAGADGMITDRPTDYFRWRNAQ